MMATGMTKTELVRHLAEKLKIGAKKRSASKESLDPRSHDGPRGVIAGKHSKQSRT